MLLKVDPKQAHRYFVKMKNPIAITKPAKIAPPMKLTKLKALPVPPLSISAFESECEVLDVELLDDGVIGVLVENFVELSVVDDEVKAVRFITNEVLVVVDEIEVEVVVLVVVLVVVVFVEAVTVVTFFLMASVL